MGPTVFSPTARNVVFSHSLWFALLVNYSLYLRPLEREAQKTSPV